MVYWGSRAPAALSAASGVVEMDRRAFGGYHRAVAYGETGTAASAQKPVT
jgi:hypothetical protein